MIVEDIDEILRVVIVDDSAGVRRMLQITLSAFGSFEVVAEAADGAEGVEAAIRCQPDLVLLDLAMPVMDGLEALPRIRRGAPMSRVVVFSGFQAAKLGEEAMALGAAAYVEKGIDAAELVRLLRTIGHDARRPTCATIDQRRSSISQA